MKNGKSHGGQEERSLMGRRLQEAASVKLAMKMQLPAETIGRLPRLELTGNRELVVDGVRSILEYGDTTICLDGGRVTVAVVGASLCLERYFAETATITGVFTSLEFR